MNTLPNEILVSIVCFSVGDCYFKKEECLPNVARVNKTFHNLFKNSYVFCTRCCAWVCDSWNTLQTHVHFYRCKLCRTPLWKEMLLDQGCCTSCEENVCFRCYHVTSPKCAECHRCCPGCTYTKCPCCKINHLCHFCMKIRTNGRTCIGCKQRICLMCIKRTDCLQIKTDKKKKKPSQYSIAHYKYFHEFLYACKECIIYCECGFITYAGGKMCLEHKTCLFCGKPRSEHLVDQCPFCENYMCNFCIKRSKHLLHDTLRIPHHVCCSNFGTLQ